MGDELPVAKQKRLVTAALPYINNIPHLGHIVGSHLPADIFARYSRAKGYETVFIGGTDEHGSPSEIAAESLGVDIEEFSSKLHGIHRNIYEWFDISYDTFSRTRNPLHYSTVVDFFNTINRKGYVEEGTMQVFYSPTDERFLPDRYVKGECPVCSYEEANSDQCEKCSSVLEPSQLINPRSIVSGSRVELRETEHLFLSLDKLAPELRAWISSQANWRSQVSGLATGWLNEGLKKRSITRDLTNGVPVPSKGFEDKVFYVWFDAPIGYLSFTKEARPDDWGDFWSGQGKVYNFLGKDNIPFHTIFWPAMLIANGNYNLPENVVGLQYLNYEGGKFSKSQRRGVFGEGVVNSSIPSDVWRAYLTQIIPETGDTEFRWDEFQERVNSDLIGNYGNFQNRTLSFIESKLGGETTRPSEARLTESDRAFLDSVRESVSDIESSLEKAELRRAYAGFLALSSLGNKYFNDNAPWISLREDRERCNDVLYLCANLGRTLAIVSAPFIPRSAENIWGQLCLPGKPSDSGIWDSAKGLALPHKHKVNKPEKLFSRVEGADIASVKEVATKGTDLSDLFAK